MIQKVIITILVIFMQSYQLMGQNFVCGTDGVINTNTKSVSSDREFQSNTDDGQFMTAYGELNILVVFMRYPDDTNVTNWPVGQDPAYDFESILADTPGDIDTTQDFNISSYFKVASKGNLIITGDAVSVVAPDSSHHYSSRYDVVTDVLTNVIGIDTTINLSEYNNWTFDNSGNGYHINQADTLVDMLVFIHKEVGNLGVSFSGEASLAGSSTVLPVNNQNIGLGYAGYGTAGSGVTAFHKYGREYAFYVAVHEIAHWLNRPHPYSDSKSNPFTGNYSFHTWMGTDWNPRVINAYERSLVGWHKPIEVTSDTVITLGDYLTTGDAARVPLSSSNPDNYLFIENHQNVNPIYDRPTDNTNEKGILMYSIDGDYGNINSVVSESAFGRWDWKQDVPLIQSPEDASDFTYVRETLGPNPLSGLNNRERRNHYESGHKKLFLAYNDDGTTVTARFDRGEYLGNMFNVNDVAFFAKNTNPAPITYTSTSQDITNQAYSDISVRLLEENPNGSIEIQVRMNDDPYIIDADTKIGGQLFVKDKSLDIKAGATLTINAGTEVFLNENKKIIVRAGAKLIVNGTQQNPVHFKRLDSSKPWGSIVIHGYNSEFNWAVFDGGTRNVDVMAPETEFNNCVFKNADRPISTYFNQSNQPGKSSFSLLNCRVENGTGLGGIVTYYADADLIDVTSQNNDDDGLWSYSGDVSMRYSVFENNGSRGIYARNGIIGSYFGDQITLNNRISDNTIGEILLGSNAVLQFGYVDQYVMLGGYNSIIVNGSNYHICNRKFHSC